MQPRLPDRQQILEMAASFQVPCVLGAAAELDVWTILGPEGLRADEVASRISADLRATTMLLDAVVALNLLEKHGDRYYVPAELRPWLRSDSPESVLPMVWHRMCMLRGWTQLAPIVTSGRPAERQASIRGAEADRAAFIAAMHTVSGPMADELVAQLMPLEFQHLLDVGGASGTWTLAFLRAVPGARATIFDLPDAIEQARARLAGHSAADRVRLVAGDFYADDLPGRADFAWVSAIAHQHSRRHNRELFRKIHAALEPGARIAVRDIVMDSSRTRPLEGALFAINMLVNTESGGTFTFDEYCEDLQAAGFVAPTWPVKTEDMRSVVMARKLR